ncbi:MAG TPA: phosphoribosylaminoimidazolesuccinocarboxamide synthase [Gemmatimonadales bacterium]
MVASDLPLPLVRRGKVREMYAVDDDTLLLVASDRVSAFDIVLPNPIPKKGAVLTQISAYWFRELAAVVPNHCLAADADTIVARVPELVAHRDALVGRAMLCRRTEPLPVECVVRGYLAGSAWGEYREHGTLAGEPLPTGLRESSRLDRPIFSPATKAESGHDENITFAQMTEIVGPDTATRLRDTSVALYEAGRDRAAGHGIIIADTKFEFGRLADGALLLIDELLTPDSSRFWPADRYEPGRGQASFDKQPLRDYLAGQKRSGAWDGGWDVPALPDEIVRATSIRYQDAFLRITGAPLPEGG